jgi:hypothetical protein
MKLTVGVHPGIPLPFSNGPNEPPDDPVGLAEPLRVATIRHDQGIRQMSALVNYWLTHSALSYDQLLAIADWGIGEKGIIDKGSLSRLRTGSKLRGASFRQIDALSAANRAIWLWQVKGQDKALRTLGPHGGWGVREEWLEAASWLPHPDHPEEPLEFADLAEVMAGYLDLPYLGPTPLAANDARHASAALAPLLDRLTVEQGWGSMAGPRNLLAAYPVGDRGRQQRLRRVIAGELRLSPDELEGELHALSEMIRTVRGLKPGEYGPRELQDELLSGDRPRRG